MRASQGDKQRREGHEPSEVTSVQREMKQDSGRCSNHTSSRNKQFLFKVKRKSLSLYFCRE